MPADSSALSLALKELHLPFALDCFFAGLIRSAQPLTRCGLRIQDVAFWGFADHVSIDARQALRVVRAAKHQIPPQLLAYLQKLELLFG